VNEAWGCWFAATALVTLTVVLWSRSHWFAWNAGVTVIAVPAAVVMLLEGWSVYRRVREQQDRERLGGGS